MPLLDTAAQMVIVVNLVARQWGILEWSFTPKSWVLSFYVSIQVNMGLICEQTSYAANSEFITIKPREHVIRELFSLIRYYGLMKLDLERIQTSQHALFYFSMKLKLWVMAYQLRTDYDGKRFLFPKLCKTYVHTKLSWAP